MTINPDIVESRKLSVIAKEVILLADLDWSLLYAEDNESMSEFIDGVNQSFATTDAKKLMEICPQFVEYMLAEQGRVDWGSIALAVDNLNGMYHPLKLTKLVMGTGQ